MSNPFPHTATPETDRPFVADLIDFLRVHREDILERWSERISHPPSPGPQTLQRQVAEVFLSLLIAQLEDPETPLDEARLRALKETVQDGLTAADLSRAQIALKRAIISALVAAYPGDRERLRFVCALVETQIDEDIIAVIDLYYRMRQRGLNGELRASEDRYGALVQTMNEGVCMVDQDFRITFFNKRMEEITGYAKEEAINRPMSLLYDGESLARVHAELERRRAGEPSIYEAVMITRGGAKVPVTISGVPLHDAAGNYAGSFGVITDISQRIETERELRHRSDEIARLLEIERKRAAQLTMVSEIARLVLSTLDPDRIMRLSAESIQRNFAYYDVFLFTVDEAANEVVLKAHAGAYREFFSEGYRQAVGVGIVGWVAQTGEVLLSNDVAREPRRILAFPQEEKTASELCVPIKLGDRVIGGIDVQSERVGAFDEHDVTSLQILANLIASAVENARLFQEMKFLKEFNDRVIDTIPLPLLFLDRDLRITSVNRAYCERRGLGRADLEGRNIREVSPDSLLLQEEVLGAISTAIREGRSVKLENVLRPREFMNKVFNIFITGVERGPERQALVVLEDITEVVERAYQLSMLRQVIGTMQGILDLDRLLYAILTCVTAGTALGFNRAILLLIDRRRNVIEGKMGVGPGSAEEAGRIWQNLAQMNLTLNDILKHYDSLSDRDNLPISRLARRISIPLTEADNLIARTVLEQRAIRVTDAYSAPEVSPEIRDILGAKEFVCVPLIAKERAVGAIIADNLYSAIPISDEGVHLLTAFASQAGLAVENAEVYAQLGDKIQELEEAYRKLHQAHDEKLRSERLAVIGELSARMAHEIRNPLATIGGFARAIARGTRPDRIEANARVIVEEVERLEKLLADTLNFTRPTSLDLKPTDLNDLAETVFGLLKGALDRGRVTLEKRLEPDLPSVVADAAQVKQVLLNLAQNACQAMPDGGTLRVSTRRMNGGVEVVVEDTGTGISPEDLRNIFNPFFTTKTSGTGLGLAISRKIVSDHAGDIAVASQPGVGTTVTVRLPIRRNET